MAELIAETRYKEVAGSTVDQEGGQVPGNGERFGVRKIVLAGDSTVTAMVVWDYGGAQQKILASACGSVAFEPDPNDSYFQFTGDGTKSLKIVLINDSLTASTFVGGYCQAVRV